MSQQQSGRDYRVLIVEDSVPVAEHLRVALSGAFHCEVRGNVADGFLRVTDLDTPPVHALLLDLILPNGSGRDVVIRFRKAFPHIPIVVITGLSHEDAGTEDLIRAGAHDVIRKPFTVDDVRDKLTWAIARHQTLQLVAPLENEVRGIKRDLEAHEARLDVHEEKTPALREAPSRSSGKFPLALACALLLGVPARAQEISLPEEIKADPGMVFIKAKTDAKEVSWWAVDGGVQMIPGDLLKDTKTAVLFVMRPGTYRLLGIVAKGDKAAWAVCVVKVGGPGPDPKPPPPDPDPDPKPKPKPDPDVPDTAMVKALKAAHALETPADKALMPRLADYYRQGAAYADDERLTLVKEVADLMKKTREALFGNALPNVRAVINAELQQVLPVAVGYPLGPKGSETRRKIADKFNEVAKALEQVK